MSAKKAAKKAPKKAAKKTPAKGPNHHKHHEGRDLRRAYEHLGRLEALQSILPAASVQQINLLSGLSRQCLAVGDHKSAADVMRAGEHLGFAALAPTTKELRISMELIKALEAEYEHLIEKAARHWDEHDAEPSAALTQLYEKAFADAETAFRKGAFRRALELARAADALAHITDPALELPPPSPVLKSGKKLKA